MLDMSSDIATQLQMDTSTKGAVIEQVLSNSPASAAGLQNMDVVVSIDGTQVKSSAEVQDYIAKQKVGQTITVGIIRSNKPLNISVTLQEKPSS
jgi:serine protease DegQ